ncbi:hypothetical protein N4T77_01755 [Clostridium sp. CX1]|uniref:hypothetical protein n=1 Tax=Clostridium sp. CX1 TaxID=2978346 RepID=UPI0021C04F51|nr:hypothetical protein [Clostridium sp. CX1]MCT8975314.1 hypothetical protein [Clostridium sp. CX1]
MIIDSNSHIILDEETLKSKKDDSDKDGSEFMYFILKFWFSRNFGEKFIYLPT